MQRQANRVLAPAAQQGNKLETDIVFVLDAAIMKQGVATMKQDVASSNNLKYAAVHTSRAYEILIQCHMRIIWLAVRLVHAALSSS